MSADASDDAPPVPPSPAGGPSTSPPPGKQPPASAYRRARHFMYEMFLTPEIETEAERWVRGGLTILIILSVLMVVLETVPSLAASYGRAFHVGEAVTVAIFTVEYLLRLWAAVEDPRYARPLLGRLRYMVSFFALVDLIAILPFYMPHVMQLDLRFVRGLRLVRLVRVFKLGRYSASLSMYGRIFREKGHELLVSLALLLLLLLMASSLMYFIEHEAQPQQFASIPASMWWGIITLTTIGYGDVVPVTALGRVLGSIIAVIGVGFVALPSAILVSGMLEQIERLKKLRAGHTPAADAPAASDAPAAAGAGARCPHCGRSLLDPPSDPSL
jgi:voltage-gated potassium channel